MTIKQILEVLNKKIDEGFGCMKIGRMENDTFCPVVDFRLQKIQMKQLLCSQLLQNSV